MALVMLEIKRSPAKVCWHVLCNGILVDTANTRNEANELLAEFNKIIN